MIFNLAGSAFSQLRFFTDRTYYPESDDNHIYSGDSFILKSNDEWGVRQALPGRKRWGHLFFYGTHDSDLIDKISDQILGVCFRDGELLEVKVMEANATLAAITEMEPQDPTELMLATQMTTVHNTVMNVFSRALKADQPLELAEFYINSATKLMRAYTAQIEAFNKYRTKGQQKITVRHVDVNGGGQAVIGDINQGGNG